MNHSKQLLLALLILSGTCSGQGCAHLTQAELAAQGLVATPVASRWMVYDERCVTIAYQDTAGLVVFNDRSEALAWVARHSAAAHAPEISARVLGELIGDQQWELLRNLDTSFDDRGWRKTRFVTRMLQGTAVRSAGSVIINCYEEEFSFYTTNGDWVQWTTPCKPIKP